MYCTTCGSKLPEDAKFCVTCGAPVDGPAAGAQTGAESSGGSSKTDDAPSTLPVEGTVAKGWAAAPSGTSSWPAPPATSAPSPSAGGSKLKKKHVLIAAGALAAVAVVTAAIVGVIWFTGMRNVTAAFGQEADVPLSKATRIIPRNKQNEPLSSYTVIVVRVGEPSAGDDTRAYAVDTTPYHMPVSTTEGFSFEQINAAIPNGRYICYIADTSAGAQEDATEDEGTIQVGEGDSVVTLTKDTPSFAVDYGEDNREAPESVTMNEPESGQVSVAAPVKTADPRQEAYKLYLDKVNEYIARYGEPGFGQGNAQDEQIGTGLIFAYLRDFDGDGLEELILGYRTDGKVLPLDVNSYAFEVWAVQDDELKLVYNEDQSFYHGQDILTGFEVVSLDDQPVMMTAVYGGGEEAGDEVSWNTCYRYKDGAFAPIWSIESRNNMIKGTSSQTVNGAEATSEEYMRALDEPQVSAFYSIAGPKDMGRWYESIANTADGRDYSVEETVAMTQETIATIKERAQGGSDQTSAAAYQAADVVERHAVTVYGNGGPNDTAQFETDWAYPQFEVVGGSTSPELESLNAQIKSDYEQALERQEGMTYDTAHPSDGSIEQTVHRFDRTVSISGDVACVRIEHRSSYGGSTAPTYVYGRYYNLRTGKEIPATDALGLSREELIQLTVDGAVAWARKAGRGLRDWDAKSAEWHLFATDATFVYRTDDAVVASFREDPFQPGAEFVIKALTDSVQVGDQLIHSDALGADGSVVFERQ